MTSSVQRLCSARLALLSLILIYTFAPLRATTDSASRERLVRYLSDAGVQMTEGNSLTLLTSGQDKFDDLFAHIRRARHHIHLEYFNFRNDSISSLLFDLLAERAAAGVQVRALFDAFGNSSNDSPLPNKMLEELRDRGIDIYKYDPIVFPWVNHVMSRDHRKIVVIDGIISYMGGMNIADYYIKGKPEIGPWHDLHCRIEGPATVELQRIFRMMWHKTTGKDFDGPEYFPDSIVREGETDLAVVDRHPRIRPKLLRRAYAQAIDTADSIVRIINPYFVPTRSISRAIRRAIERGVEVHIMVSDKSDIPFTPDAMLHKLRGLAKRGAQVHLYTQGFHHTKLITIDGSHASIGSLNLNSRSLRYDSETNIFIIDSAKTAELDSLYLHEQELCTPLDDAYWQRRSGWRKFVGWFANLLTPFL